MNSYLLIISCSQRKVETPESLPALERYDGVVYRTLRKAKREGWFPSNLDVLIISAAYGLLPNYQPINDYERRITPERARQLLPAIQRQLQTYINGRKYTQVFINLGKVYMQTLEGFDWGLVSTMEASGGIGQKTSQMKAWLERIADNKGKEKVD